MSEVWYVPSIESQMLGKFEKYNGFTFRMVEAGADITDSCFLQWQNYDKFMVERFNNEGREVIGTTGLIEKEGFPIRKGMIFWMLCKE